MRKEWGRKVPVPFRPPAAPVVLEAICGCPLLHPFLYWFPSLVPAPKRKVPVLFCLGTNWTVGSGEMRMSFIGFVPL